METRTFLFSLNWIVIFLFLFFIFFCLFLYVTFTDITGRVRVKFRYHVHLAIPYVKLKSRRSPAKSYLCSARPRHALFRVRTPPPQPYICDHLPHPQPSARMAQWPPQGCIPCLQSRLTRVRFRVSCDEPF